MLVFTLMFVTLWITQITESFKNQNTDFYLSRRKLKVSSATFQSEFKRKLDKKRKLKFPVLLAEQEEFSQIKDGLKQSEFNSIIEKEQDFNKAMDFLKYNSDSLDLTRDNFRLCSKLLSMMSKSVIEGSENEAELIEDKRAVELYKELKQRNLLRGFGCVDANSYPVNASVIGTEDMQKITKLPISALTPSGMYDNYWLFLGIGLCAVEFGLGQYLGIDPLDTWIPATAAVILLDKVFMGGAIFDQLLQRLVPGLKDKIIRHEAGHFLCAYLLGCPIQGILLNPLQLRNFVSGGQGGTLFTDADFIQEVRSGTLSRRTIDRFAIILMGGIAAEALEFGSADGGQGDESQLIGILQSVRPPWTIGKIKEQARWAAAQAVLLITEHKACYDALVAKIKEDAPLGECIKSIEEALPEGLLPVERRMQLQAGLIQRQAAIDGQGLSPDEKVKQDSLKEDLTRLASKLQEKLQNPSTIERTQTGGVWINDLSAVQKAQTSPLPPLIKVEQVNYKERIKILEEEEKENARKLSEVETKLAVLIENEKKIKANLL